MLGKTLKAMGGSGAITGFVHKEKHKSIGDAETRQVYGMK